MFQFMIGVAIFLVVAPILIFLAIPFMLWALVEMPWLLLLVPLGILVAAGIGDWLDNRA